MSQLATASCAPTKVPAGAARTGVAFHVLEHLRRWAGVSEPRRGVPGPDLDARFPSHARLPAVGRERADVLSEVWTRAEAERWRWAGGYASGAVYHGDSDHIGFLNEVYSAASQLNPLHTDLWPSGVKYESEIVAMTAAMLHGGPTESDDGAWPGAVGTVTSGGTESILLAMKAYRDHARATRGVERGRIVAPVTAHAAFEKAAAAFGLDLVGTAVDDEGRAVVAAVADAVDDDTIVVVGSAPNYPYGTIDPIGPLSELARSRGIGFHTDACLGGFVLPWAERLRHPVPAFDFRLPGVTSMSCDTHKYGYAAKGTSVVLYRTPELRHHQYFTVTDWPGGLYASPTFAGSRPGGLSAACWAALVSIGEDGYLRAADAILRTTANLRAALAEQVPELRLIGDSLFVVAFASASADLDVYRVNDAMTERGWALNGLHRPPAVHLAVTLRHTAPGVAERFVGDLRASVDQVSSSPPGDGGMAPIYGLGDSLPDRGAVADQMRVVIDSWFDRGR
jgi:sphinganine-1-phosphate aldolase